MWTTIDKWYTNVADPYYTKIDKLYQKANSLPAAEAGAVYDEIRALQNSTKPRFINGIKMPTPEQVAFFSKSPEEQQTWKIKQLNRPGWWLDAFQQKQLAYGGSAKVQKFTTDINEMESDFRRS